MDAQELRDLQEAYNWVYSELDEGSGWRDNRGKNIPNNLPVKAVSNHLRNSGRTREPTPANLARRELKARDLEKRAKDLETRDRTNRDRYFSSTLDNPHSMTDNSSTSSKLISRAKAIRAVSRSQTRRTSEDEDNQRIANSVSHLNGFDIPSSVNSRRSRNQTYNRNRPNNQSNFERSTSHLDLSKIDPDSYGTKRRTKPKRKPTKSSDETKITKKDKNIIYKWEGTPEFGNRSYYSANKISKFRREEYDIYDIILTHLLDEGYAETLGAAEAIMVSMSEEWREDVIEKYIVFYD